MDELSFTTRNFKNLYFHNINYDKQQIIEKYGIQYDPLYNHIDFNQIEDKKGLNSSRSTYILSGRTFKKLKSNSMNALLPLRLIG